MVSLLHDRGAETSLREDTMTSRRAALLTLALMLAVPAIAGAGIGDYHMLNGTITLWGPHRFGEQLATLQEDSGQHWVLRFAPGTLPAGAAVGTELAVMGRESAVSNQLDVVAASLASSVSALPTDAASGWAVVPGAVQQHSGTTGVVRANGGTVVTVDTSQLDADARGWFTPGNGVTVVGVYRADGVLIARGIATSRP